MEEVFNVKAWTFMCREQNSERTSFNYITWSSDQKHSVDWDPGIVFIETRQSVATEKTYGLRSTNRLHILIWSYCLLVNLWHRYCLFDVQRVVHCPHRKAVRCSFLMIIKAAINAPRINLIGYVSCLKWQKSSVQKPGLVCAVSRTQKEQVLTISLDHQTKSIR